MTPSLEKKSIDPIDTRLGELLRLTRTACGISQEKLGAMNGLTFQQIQKYERGQNRVSVSRLMHIAECLGVSATRFIENLGEDKAVGKQAFKVDLTLFNGRENQELLRAYVNIADKDERRFLRLLTTLLADRTTGRRQ
jgi:transcriptional regulator with XRE-family HTH domain